MPLDRLKIDGLLCLDGTTGDAVIAQGQQASSSALRRNRCAGNVMPGTVARLASGRGVAAWRRG